MKEYYTVEDVAKMLSVHQETVRRWIKSKKLKAYKVGKAYRMTKGHIEEMLQVE